MWFSVACFGGRISVTFHLMFVHYSFSLVWVAEWPPFGKDLPIWLAVFLIVFGLFVVLVISRLVLRAGFVLFNNNDDNNKDFIKRGGPAGLTSNLPWGPHFDCSSSCSLLICYFSCCFLTCRNDSVLSELSEQSRGLVPALNVIAMRTKPIKIV